MGRAFTTVDVDRVTPESVVGAIRDGRTDFRVVERAQDRYLRQLYGVVHRLKGHTSPIERRPTRE